MNIKFQSLNVNINYIFLGLALIGPALSFGPVYLFHFFAMILFFMSFKYLKIKKYNLKLLFVPLSLVLFSLISLIWSPSLLIGLRQIFYLNCGLFILFVLVSCVDSVEDLKKVFSFFCILMLVNLGIGFLETLNLIRLPTSPLSPYADLFMRESLDPNEFFGDQLEYLYSMPTGFTGNPNNFGFIVLLGFPFIFCFFKKIYLKVLMFFLTSYLIFFIDSRGLLVSLVLLLVAYFLVYLLSVKNKNLILFSLMGVIFIIFIVIRIFIEKFFLIYEDILSAIEMMKYGVVDFDSTGVRSYIYSEGFRGFLENPFFGGGIGSMQTKLMQDNFILVKSFHYFPFELLIDIGIVFFCLILISYVYLIIAMYKIYIRNNNDFLKKIAIACFFSLIIYPFASIVPSSTVYILPFWYVLGLSLATLKVGYYEKA